MPRLNHIILTLVFASASAVVLEAQENRIPLNSNQSRVHQLRTPPQAKSILNSTKNVTNRLAKVPAELVADPGKIRFDSIASEKTPVPAALRGKALAQPAADPKPQPAIAIAPAELMTPRVAQAGTESWTHTTRSGRSSQRSQSRAAAPQARPASNISRSAPALTTEIVAPEFINVNQTATMKIQLRNTGSAEAQNVRLVTTLPMHARFESSEPQPVKVDGQRYEFLVSSVGVNQVRQIAINLVPTEKLPLDIGTDLMIENRQRIAVGVRQPELHVNVKGPAQASIGQPVEYTVVIENTGDGVAETVRLEAEFPEELRFTEQTGMEVAKRLEPGKTRTVVVKSIAQGTGIVDLAFAANAVDVKSAPASMKLKIVQPELKVSVAGPKLNFVNRDGIYSIRLDNPGEVEVSKIEVKLEIPTGMKVTTINRPANADDQSQTLTWTFDKIAAQGSEIIQLKAIATKPGNQICRIDVNTHETRQKRFELATRVETRAEMSVNMRNESGPVQVGEKAQFVIAIENKGSRDAEDVSVRVELPESLMPVKQDGVTVDEFNRSFVFNKSGLPAGKEHEFRFSAVGVAGGEFVVRGVLENGQSQRSIIAEDTVYVYEVDEARVSESLSPSLSR